MGNSMENMHTDVRLVISSVHRGEIAFIFSLNMF